MHITTLEIACNTAGCGRQYRIASPDLDADELRALIARDGWCLAYLGPQDFCPDHNQITSDGLFEVTA